MRNRRAEVAVLLAMISLVLVFHPFPLHARAPKPANKPARETTTQPPPRWEAELAALRQQVQEQRHLIETLRRQIEEKRGTGEDLAARLDARRAVEDALLDHLEHLQQEGQRQRSLLYGAIGAIIVLGVLLHLQGRSANHRPQNRRILRILDNWPALK